MAFNQIFNVDVSHIRKHRLEYEYKQLTNLIEDWNLNSVIILDREEFKLVVYVYGDELEKFFECVKRWMCSRRVARGNYGWLTTIGTP